MAKPGRKLDKRQTNRRQKHELAYRSKKWRCSKLAVILADILGDRSVVTAREWVAHAQGVLRRANREARRRG